MPRPIRYIIPDFPHHAIQRGNNHQNIFFDKEDHLHFLSNIKRLSKEEGVLIGAYCLMLNHFHLLLYPDTSTGLINFMKSIAQLHTQMINKKYNRSGKLWENRYRLNLVDPDHEWTISRYIDNNPLRAKIVDDPSAYPYSSAKSHLSGCYDELLTKDIISTRHGEYKTFFEEALALNSEHIVGIREIIRQEKALGNAGFLEKLEEKFKRCFSLRKRGRPFKNGCLNGMNGVAGGNK